MLQIYLKPQNKQYENNIMHIKKLTFISKKIPSPQEIHCFFTTLTDKRLDPVKGGFSVSYQGRIVTILISALEPSKVYEKTVELNSNIFEFRKVEVIENSFNYIEKNDLVTVAVELVYTKHTGFKSKSPWSSYGTMHPDLAEHFYSYFKNKTGLSVIESSVTIAPASVTDQRLNKVWFNGQASVSLTGVVENEELFKSLGFRSIGRRKSYGFGFVHIIDVKKDELNQSVIDL